MTFITVRPYEMYGVRLELIELFYLQWMSDYSSKIYCKWNNFISYNLTSIHCPIYHRALQFASKYYVSLDSLPPIYRANTLQFRDGGLILCWRRTRKFLTYREHTENRQRTDRESNYRGHSNRRLIVGYAGQYFCHFVTTNKNFMPSYNN